MLRRTARLLPALLAVAAATYAVPGGPAGAATATTSTTSTTTTLTATKKVVVRPVGATGRARVGWPVHREGDGSLSCDDQSPYSVSDHVDICYPTAAYAPSCWRSFDHTVLCLRDVEVKQLVRFRYAGTFAGDPALLRAKRSPQGLRLADGERCTVRVGGAWGYYPSHPTWVGFYSCDGGSIYGPDSGDGISRTNPVWTVHVIRNDGSVVVRKVTRATYVGTAS
ncbi:hypothetical protein [Nocardioides montaniterrae]